MKKRLFIAMLIGLLVICLSACGGSDANAAVDSVTQTSSQPDTKQDTPIVTPTPEPIDYAFVRTDMANMNSGGRFLVDDGYVYSLNFPKKGGKAIFGKMKLDRSEYTVLNEDGCPALLTKDGNKLYFLLWIGDYAYIFCSDLDGSNQTQLVEGTATDLRVTKNYIYYNRVNEEDWRTCGFYRADKDGKNETLILDKEIYYPYIVGDTLYYQDDADNETEHRYNLTTKTDEKLTSTFTYAFVVDEEYGYYVANDNSIDDDDMVGSLVKMNLKTKEETVLFEGVDINAFAMNESKIFFVNANDSHRIYSMDKDGTNATVIVKDKNCDYLELHDNRLCYVVFDKNWRLINQIYLCDTDGSNKIKFRQ